MLRDVRKEVSPVVLIVVSCLVPILQHAEGLNNSLIENSAITLGRLAWVCLTTHRAFHAAVVYSLVHERALFIKYTVIKVFSNGEIKQAFRLFDCDVHMDEYLIRVTTKQLPQSPLAPKEPPSSAASAVVDDILDFTQLGKPTGSDLAKGNLTAPVIFALEKKTKLKDIIESEFCERAHLRRRLIVPGELVREITDRAVVNLKCLLQSWFSLMLY
ncbi:hypothetical protein CASFOL_029279 [Castilleja foliolosa]|uniref:Uncharacterized protein n=1 Tax=Castilleja foliolosa TaxID=1961234 RepID=A0ABD3CC10_9LAMI